MKTIMAISKDKGIDRIFMIIKVLLAVSPFMALGYLSANGVKYGGSLQTILNSNPDLAVMFLVAMVNPFIAYLLGYVEQHLKKADNGYVLLNLGLMIVAELMIENIMYALILAFLIYKCVKTYQIPVKESIKASAKDHLLRDISGSIVVLIFAGICLFARIQIGM